jgi:hypothetical protein
MALPLQSLAELTERSERAHREAKEIIAKNKAAMEKSRQLLERSHAAIHRDPLHAGGTSERVMR